MTKCCFLHGVWLAQAGSVQRQPLLGFVPDVPPSVGKPSARPLIRCGLEGYRCVRINRPEDRWEREPRSRLRADALKLPEAERADLAHARVESLDAPADVDVAEEWNSEVRRRLAEIDAGTANLIDRDEFRRRLQAGLGGR